MRKDTNLIIINGVSIPAPDEGFSIQEITNVDAGRNSNGTVVGQRVGRNIWKIQDLKWSTLSANDWKKLKNALKPFFVSVTFTADDNKRHTVTMYPGDRQSKPYQVHNLTYSRFRECSFNLIDCGRLSSSGGEA